jgi:hypothetical protein
MKTLAKLFLVIAPPMSLSAFESEAAMFGGRAIPSAVRLLRW